jgi:hypothetical protein
MALKNIKKHLQCVNLNKGILATDQVQLVATATVPTDANLADGRIYYNSGLGAFRGRAGGAWITMANAGGAGIGSWDALYDVDKTMSVDDGTVEFAGALTNGANDVLTLSAVNGQTGDVLQFSNAGSGSDIKGTSSTWSVSKAGAAIFNASVTTAAIVSYGAGGNANLTIDAKGSGTIAIGATSTGAITLTRATSTTAALTVGTTLTVTGGADADRFVITAGDILVSDGHMTMVQPDNEASLEITAAGTTTANGITLTVDAITTGSALYIDNGGATMEATGFYINCNDDTVAVFSVGADGATVIASAVNSTVALSVAGIQTNEDMVKFSSNGVTATGQSTLLVTAAGATAAGSAVLLVNHTGTPAASTSYLAVFDYTPATEETNDPITVEIRSGASIGAALNIISTATTITGGIINITNGLTTGVGINISSAAMTTGQLIKLTHATEVIADTGSMIRATSSGINTGGATNGTVLDLKTTGQLAGTMCRIDSIQTTGTVMSIISSGTMTTTGNLLTLTANTATTANGLLIVNCNGITSGDGIAINSSSTAVTSGTLLRVAHSGASTTTALAPLSIFSTAATDNTTVIQIIDAGDLAGGIGLDISLAATTTGTGIDMGNFNAVTSGKGIFIDNSVSTLTSGYLIHLDSASTAMTTGRLLLVDHTGNATATAMCSVAEIKTAAAENTVILSLTASDVLAGGIGLDIAVAAMTTGTALDIGGMAALTTGNGIVVAASGTTRTDGMLLSLTCASTGATSTGRMLLVNHTGGSGTSTILTEIKTAATDETVALQVLASGALALGNLINVSGAAMTTGIGLNMANLDALTTGTGIIVKSNSADATARNLVYVENTHASAVGVSPIKVKQVAVTSTHFYKVMTFQTAETTNALWIGDSATSPNAALAATTGDVLINGDGGKIYNCTNGAGSLWSANN